MLEHGTEAEKSASFIVSEFYPQGCPILNLAAS
jgi:hypothetical protein